MTQTIQFIFEPLTSDTEISDFSLGDMTLVIGDETISSKSAWENNMMLFVSLEFLLSGVTDLLTSPRKASVFDAISSRFGFEIHKMSLGMVRILYRERWIGTVSLLEFAQALYRPAAILIAVYRDGLTVMGKDLDEDLSDLKHAIDTYQPPAKKLSKGKGKRSHKAS